MNVKDSKILNTEEAREFFLDKSYIDIVVDVDTWAWFFTTDYCIGNRLNLPSCFVPMSKSNLPQTIEDYISIYHKKDKQICSLQELENYLKNKNNDVSKSL